MTALTSVASTTVPTEANASVTPIALSCSSQSVGPRAPERFVFRFGLASGVARKPVSSAPMRAADAVHAERVERVVVAEEALELRAREVRDGPREHADEDRAVRGDEPRAGVITTRPATAPEQKPSTVGLPRVTHSMAGQVTTRRPPRASSP